jgi:hypothetical protein
MDSVTLHRVAGRLCRDFRSQGVTPRQDWLLTQLINELEHRRRTAVNPIDRCACYLCNDRDLALEPLSDSGRLPEQ